VQQLASQFRVQAQYSDARLLPLHQEIAFATLEDDMRCAEDYVRYACRWLLQHCRCSAGRAPLAGCLISCCQAPPRSQSGADADPVLPLRCHCRSHADAQQHLRTAVSGPHHAVFRQPVMSAAADAQT
jgi:hypothetical protein